jgi:flagellar hook-basal body complex protein FliE
MSISPISAIAPAFSAQDVSMTPNALKPGYGPESLGATPESSNINGVNATPAQSFGQMLTNAIAETNQAQLHAGDMTARFAAGEPMDIHQVMIASQEASVSLNLAMQVRNKVVDAYTELMHVNV